MEIAQDIMLAFFSLFCLFIEQVGDNSGELLFTLIVTWMIFFYVDRQYKRAGFTQTNQRVD